MEVYYQKCMKCKGLEFEFRCGLYVANNGCCTKSGCG